ncbi:MAG: putative DNA binding domain-containing protein [Desulfobacterium sp.]|nr:putative DNA binding domain-containing protein [Desulfobacterium sp.]
MSKFYHRLLEQQEGKTIEFKRDLSSPKPMMKALVAFANTAGGRLIIGVNDDRQILGVDDPLSQEERLCSMIADSIAPRLVPNIEMVTIEDKTLLIAEVFLSSSRPHFLRSEGAETGVYVRLGSTNRQADRELISELRRSVEGVAFDEMSMPELSIDDIDTPAIAQSVREKYPIGETAFPLVSCVKLSLMRWFMRTTPSGVLQSALPFLMIALKSKIPESFCPA